jgi:hypothetical protein
MDLQKVIDNHSKEFGEIPRGLPTTQDHDHDIYLNSPNIGSYRHPYA